mmetsp:Transcript_91740/g.127388  ORF Transcript_91740/g.127388 Transcript_91740/m.127388 type:complete len:200 (-) Transcript_91740:419-1018(-)
MFQHDPFGLRKPLGKKQCSQSKDCKEVEREKPQPSKQHRCALSDCIVGNPRCTNSSCHALTAVAQGKHLGAVHPHNGTPAVSEVGNEEEDHADHHIATILAYTNMCVVLGTCCGCMAERSDASGRHQHAQRAPPQKAATPANIREQQGRKSGQEVHQTRACLEQSWAETDFQEYPRTKIHECIHSRHLLENLQSDTKEK